MSSYSSLLVDIGGTNMRYAYANKRNISEEKILSNISDQKINKTLGNLLSNPQIKNAVIAINAINSGSIKCGHVFTLSTGAETDFWIGLAFTTVNNRWVTFTSGAI